MRRVDARTLEIKRLRHPARANRQSWMDAGARMLESSRVMTILDARSVRLSHHRGSQVLIRCAACGHKRQMTAEALARIIGWDAEPFAMTERFRCSRCGAHRAEVSLGHDRKPRGAPRILHEP